MNYHISGSSGFIGQAIMKYLREKKELVFPIPRDQSIYELRTLFWFNKPDYIIHLATYGNHHDQRDFKQMVKTNILGTYNLLEAASTTDYKLFYNITTSSVLLKDQTPYSITKLCAEQLAGMYKNVVNVRPYSVYGPGEAKHRFIPTVIDCLDSGSEMILDGDAEHSWIFIDDFIEAMFAGKTEIGGFKAKNSLIVSLLEDISGKRLRYKSGKLRNYDCGDVASPEIGYTGLYDGLKMTYERNNI